ncbi:hypothetical protein ACQ4PT_000094 [Festuca glaucescens]
MEAVGTIVKVVQEIVKAAETARQNRRRCLDLADRARTVGDILREDRGSTTSRIAGGVSRAALERLKAALDDALELDVETRITACVVDLGLAEQIAASRRDHRADEEAAPVHEPPPPQQQGKEGGPSLPQGYQAQSAPPPSAQRGKDAQAFLQEYHAQSAQRGKDAQVFLQAYHAQREQLGKAAQRGKDAQAMLQGYLAQSASSQQQGQDVQSLLKGYGYFAM